MTGLRILFVERLRLVQLRLIIYAVCIGVASYGALGHVPPPLDLQQLNFLVRFDLYKV